MHAGRAAAASAVPGHGRPRAGGNGTSVVDMRTWNRCGGTYVTGVLLSGSARDPRRALHRLLNRCGRAPFSRSEHARSRTKHVWPLTARARVAAVRRPGIRPRVPRVRNSSYSRGYVRGAVDLTAAARPFRSTIRLRGVPPRPLCPLLRGEGPFRGRSVTHRITRVPAANSLTAKSTSGTRHISAALGCGNAAASPYGHEERRRSGRGERPRPDLGGSAALRRALRVRAVTAPVRPAGRCRALNSPADRSGSVRRIHVAALVLPRGPTHRYLLVVDQGAHP